MHVIIGSTSTPQIHSMCIPHRRNPSPTTAVLVQKLQLMPVKGDTCLNVTITRTTADSQGGQEKPALQETWVGLRQPAASTQSFYITMSSQLKDW